MLVCPNREFDGPHHRARIGDEPPLDLRVPQKYPSGDGHVDVRCLGGTLGGDDLFG